MSSTEIDVKIRKGQAWAALNKLNANGNPTVLSNSKEGLLLHW